MQYVLLKQSRLQKNYNINRVEKVDLQRILGQALGGLKDCIRSQKNILVSFYVSIKPRLRLVPEESINSRSGQFNKLKRYVQIFLLNILKNEY